MDDWLPSRHEIRFDRSRQGVLRASCHDCGHGVAAASRRCSVCGVTFRAYVTPHSEERDAIALLTDLPFKGVRWG